MNVTQFFHKSKVCSNTQKYTNLFMFWNHTKPSIFILLQFLFLLRSPLTCPLRIFFVSEDFVQVLPKKYNKCLLGYFLTAIRDLLAKHTHTWIVGSTSYINCHFTYDLYIKYPLAQPNILWRFEKFVNSRSNWRSPFGQAAIPKDNSVNWLNISIGFIVIDR